MKRRDTVLVVDDVPGTLGLLNDVLEAAGFTVLLAQSAGSALSILERITPDVALVDAVMPEMDGFALCRVMKLKAGLAAVPVIFMTGLTETEHVMRGFQAGGVDYVTKPVSPDEVVARIGVHIANARRTRSAQFALDASGRFLIGAAPDGRVLWATPQAAELLEEAGGGRPGGVRVWEANRPSLGDPAIGSRVAVLESGHLQLELRFVGRLDADEILLRVVKIGADTAEDLLRRRLGLTAREAEVLRWISHGKSNRDIAEILGMRPTTVTKHLEQIYTKLGVENRSSAAAMALRVAGQEDGAARPLTPVRPSSAHPPPGRTSRHRSRPIPAPPPARWCPSHAPRARYGPPCRTPRWGRAPSPA